MKQVYPARYRRSDVEERGTYFIVANDVDEAEEIAFSCIAKNPPPSSEGPDRPASHGKTITEVWVMDSWAQPTETDKSGLIRSGSEVLAAKALAQYIEENNKLNPGLKT